MRALVLLLVTGLTLTAAGPKGPRYSATLGKKDDKVELVAKKDKQVFVVTSKSGIGSLVIDREGPAQSQMTFQLAGLRTLEGVTWHDGTRKLRGALPRGMARVELGYDKAGKRTRDRKAAAVTLSLAKKAGRPKIEVVVTYAAGLAPGKRCKLEWVNEYR
jgi:hypothetical protein